MITCHSIQRLENIGFDNYLLLPQYSHSFLKNEKHGYNQICKVTAKMQLGTLVDGIRTGCQVDMRHQLYPTAKKIAAQLQSELGWALDKLDKQVSYTGIMRFDAGNAIFELPIKGRPDFELKKKLLLI